MAINLKTATHQVLFLQLQFRKYNQLELIKCKSEDTLEKEPELVFILLKM